ncbi:MAG: putative Ig domain-containing protein, partial [Limisphaerales bacterium]
MNTLRLLLLIATLLSASELTARNFRVIGPPNGGIPNGTRFDGVGCINCHFNPAGAGLRNNFGNAVFSAIGGSSGNIQFWNAAFAALDSDNDGFTNGEELGDEDGDGVPERTTGITNPGDPQSKPALNTTPVFTSSPLIGATKGINYAYQATATDPDQQSLSFFKVSGPSWLTVSIAGLVSGTPPDDANTTAAVTIRVIDNGSPPASADHSFNINLIATFLGWQRLNFASGENDPNAGSALDPENDRVPNFIEYALRGSP